MPKRARTMANSQHAPVAEANAIEQEADKIGAELDSLIAGVEESFHASVKSRDNALRARLAGLTEEIARMTAALDVLSQRQAELDATDATKPAAKADVKKAPSDTPRGTRRKEFPPLPRKLTVAVLERYLADHGIDVENNRKKSSRQGGFWAYASKTALQPFVEELKQRGISCRYYEEGQRRRNPHPCWEIDNTKTLTSI